VSSAIYVVTSKTGYIGQKGPVYCSGRPKTTINRVEICPINN
jgi:hypothetical protein